eukprot:jgi/Ulvmu1/8251/UM041_0062.1
METDKGLTMQCIGGKTVTLSINQEKKVSDLRRLACNQMNCEQATLVANGMLLKESDDTRCINEMLGSNGTVLAAPVRKRARRRLIIGHGDLLAQQDAYPAARQDAGTAEGESMDDDPAEAPACASAMQVRIGNWMKRNKFPSSCLAVFYLLSLKQWSLLGFWILGGPFAARHGFGALYMGVTFVFLIFRNLGRREPGEASAYSIFNDDFRRLPGDFTDDQVDNAFRGQM